MTKLSSNDKQRVSDALTECARRTKDIDNPSKLADAAYSILSEKLGDNQGLFKAACQVYNSCKSIHRLSEASDDTRGNTFAILDVQDMLGRLQTEKAVQIRKAASAPAKFSRITPASGLTKAASTKIDRQAQDYRPVAPRVSVGDFKQYLRAEIADIEDFIHKSAGIATRLKSLRDEAIEAFSAAFAVEPSSLRKDAAARLVANYGDSAKRLIEAFADRRPLSKLASADYENKYKGTPQLPHGVIHNLAKEAMDISDTYHRFEQDRETILDSVARSVVDYAKTYIGICKKAADPGTVVVGAGALKGLNEMLGLDESTDAQKYRDDIFTTELVNNMLAHSYQRAFMRAATQSAISKYALDRIVSAFNRAVAKLPANTRMVPATANQSLIEGMMIDELAKGSVPSKADTEVISSLANTIGKLQSDKGIYKGNESHA